MDRGIKIRAKIAIAYDCLSLSCLGAEIGVGTTDISQQFDATYGEVGGVIHIFPQNHVLCRPEVWSQIENTVLLGEGEFAVFLKYEVNS